VKSYQVVQAAADCWVVFLHILFARFVESVCLMADVYGSFGGVVGAGLRDWMDVCVLKS